MINAAFAEKYFGEQNPLGQRVNIGAGPANGAPPREIIGVVGTAKHGSLAEPESPEFYVPFSQDPDSYMEIVVRTSAATSSGMESMIRRTVHEIDSQQFVPEIRSLSSLVSRTLSQTRFNTALLGVFAAVAIILAAVGIYGVIAYNVAQRTKEIGIRMALGAQQRQMLTMILRQSLTMAAIGIGVGLLGVVCRDALAERVAFRRRHDRPADLRRGHPAARAAALLAGLFPGASRHESRSCDRAAL